MSQLARECHYSIHRTQKSQIFTHVYIEAWEPKPVPDPATAQTPGLLFSGSFGQNVRLRLCISAANRCKSITATFPEVNMSL